MGAVGWLLVVLALVQVVRLALAQLTQNLEAYYNAIAQQDAQLAAGAQQAGMDQARFGAGLLGTAGNLLTQGYGGQASALDPYRAYLSGATGLEALGQQSFDMGSGIGAKVANPSGGQFLLSGGMGAAESLNRANSYNPFATALTSASRNPTLVNAASPYINAFRASNQYGAENVYGYGGRGTVPTSVDFNTGFD